VCYVGRERWEAHVRGAPETPERRDREDSAGGSSGAASGASSQGDPEAVRRAFADCGQDYVFRFWEELDEAGRGRLMRQAADLAPRLPALVRAFREAREQADRVGREARIEPPDVIELPEHGGDAARRERARERGERMLREGRVAALVVAGGQGTRLGFDGPKGAYPLGPVTDRTLYEIHAQKVRGLARRYRSRVPLYVMTSDATDAATREHFERHDRFGLDAADLHVFRQGMVPAFDFDGRLVLDAPDHVFESPNGHGGSLTALLDSGSLDALEARGIDTLFYFQVDNPLVQLCDPGYLGLHDELGAEMSCKVLRKPDPEVKWGVVARVDGRLGIVEYTELDDAMRYARDDDGELRFWAGSPAIHVLSTAFVRRMAERADELLPYHLSAKKVPAVDDAGRTVKPDEPNAWKLERFVFDALPAASQVAIVEARIAEEFSPVKNASGPESPETARRDLVAEYQRWLRAAGLEPPADRALEIDHSRIDGPEDAAQAGLESLESAGDVVRLGPGTRE